MDTVFSIDLYHKTNEKKNSQQLKASSDILQNLSAELDCHNTDSILSQLNQTGSIDDTDGILTDLIAETRMLQERFGNAVQLSCRPLTKLWNIGNENAAVPLQKQLIAASSLIDDQNIRLKDGKVTLCHGAELDLGAVAKGYALDRLYAYYDELDDSEKPQYAVISAASAVMLYGEKADKVPFTIEISDPNSSDMLGRLTIPPESGYSALFLGTSGNAERFSSINGTKYGHIFDLSTGYPAESDLASVTVLTDQGLKADFLSTLIFIGGTASLSSHLSASDYAVLAVDHNGKIYQSDSLRFEVYQ